MPRVSVLIKALNEERRIGACLDSVMVAIAGLDAEVVLVDSCSTDCTVEIARNYPIRIVQFSNPQDRGCGAAVQLGYQESNGDYVYVLDADMCMAPGFLREAISRLEADPSLAGVGGRLEDQFIRTEYDQRRAIAATSAARGDAVVSELGGGGLYRRAAIESAGYLANRWLQAYEEAELAIRLRVLGWRLMRVGEVAVTHSGHQESNRTMLARLWRNRRAHATGAFLRAAVGHPWWWEAFHKQRFVLLTLFMYALSIAGFVALLCAQPSWSVWAGLLLLMPLLLIFGLQLVKKRSLAGAAWSTAAWHVFAVASVIGFAAKPLDPAEKIAFRTLVE